MRGFWGIAWEFPGGWRRGFGGLWELMGFEGLGGPGGGLFGVCVQVLGG